MGGNRKSSVRSLLERLEALEGEDVFAPGSSAHRSVPAPVAARHTRDLRDYFNMGFASAFIGGGIALLTLLFVNPADARVDAGSGRDSASIRLGMVRIQSAPEVRQLWWRLPLSVDHAAPRLARVD